MILSALAWPSVVSRRDASSPRNRDGAIAASSTRSPLNSEATRRRAHRLRALGTPRRTRPSRASCASICAGMGRQGASRRCRPTNCVHASRCSLRPPPRRPRRGPRRTTCWATAPSRKRSTPAGSMCLSRGSAHIGRPCTHQQLISQRHPLRRVEVDADVDQLRSFES